MGCFACRASKVFLLFFCSRHEVQVTFPQVTVKVTTLEINKQQVSPNTAGSEINFLLQAPTGDQV